MKSIYFILTVIGVMSLTTPVFCQSESYSQYQGCIQAIHRQVVDLTASDDLFEASNFVAIYSDPNAYLTNAMRYLGDVTNSDECKMIVVYSLQRLQLDDYVNYERNLLHLARAGSLSKSALNKAVFPALEWSTKIQINFEKPNVRKLLQECVQSDLITPENKAYSRDVLSGKAKQDVAELEGDGMLPKVPNPASDSVNKN
jgi:hypothetical protein